MAARFDAAFDPDRGTASPEAAVVHRRRWLKAAGFSLSVAGLAAAGYGGWRSYRGSDEQVLAQGRPDPPKTKPAPPADDPAREEPFYPAPRDERFAYGRAETPAAAAARYTNFYEFTTSKFTWRYVDKFRTSPWQITIDGLCRQPLTLEVDELLRRFRAHRTERLYRHRCVERWAMAVPWTGFPLAEILAAVEPLPQAKYVRFVSFLRPEEAPTQQNGEYPWPYTEGLTLAEARNPLTMLVSGIYGRPLLKQHGAPLRIVVPWKYGYKSAKSIERIELVAEEPKTFWTTLMPWAYPFESNVNPLDNVPWNQSAETMLDTGEMFPTQLYNGYGEYVADLYARA